MSRTNLHFDLQRGDKLVKRTTSSGEEWVVRPDYGVSFSPILLIAAVVVCLAILLSPDAKEPPQEQEPLRVKAGQPPATERTIFDPSTDPL